MAGLDGKQVIADLAEILGGRLMSALGQSRRFDVRPATSGLPRATDIVSAGRQVGLVPKAEKTVQLLPNKFATGTVNFRSKVDTRNASAKAITPRQSSRCI